MNDPSPDASSLDASYSLREYGAMFTAPVRAPAYVAALEAAVRPGSVVVEVGAGAGLFALLACKLGAARVYAIEASPLIDLAPVLAADNGFADRLACIQALSTQVELPERADVLFGDLRGVLPFYLGSVASMIDARDRFLKPGGILIPKRDTLWCAVLHAPDRYAAVVGPWAEGARGMDLYRGLEIAVNGWAGSEVEPAQLLSDAAEWGAIDYATVSSPRLEGAADCTVTRAAAGHGMAVWFDAELADGIGFSNAPSHPRLVYGQAFFPWRHAVDLAVGDVVHTEFRVLPGHPESIWVWDTSIRDALGNLRTTFKQSTFWAQVMPAAEHRRRADSHVPTLSEFGMIDRDILTWLDGQRSLGDVATMVHERYSAKFKDWESAMTLVADISRANELIPPTCPE